MINKFILVLVFFIFPQLNAQAEKWVYIDSDVYIDTDSRSRKGDLATIKTKIAGGVVLIEVDCKNDRVINPSEMRDFKVSSDSLLGGVIKSACTKWYQVWK